MAKSDITRQKIKSQLSAIKKINDDPKAIHTNIFDKYNDKLSSTEGVTQKGINDFTSKVKGRVQNKKDIFKEVLDTVDAFLGSNKEYPNDSKSKPFIKSKTLKYSIESANSTIRSSKQIIINEVKKKFFGGGGLCEANGIFGVSSLYISPKSFDLMNVLTLDPESMSGKVVYENSELKPGGYIKFNRELFSNFDSGETYTFQSRNYNKVFDIQWIDGSQKYYISNLSTGMKIGDFIESYYSTIEYPDINEVMKNTMLMTLQGDGSETQLFQKGMNDLNRLTQKLFCLCGEPTTNKPLLNNATNQLSEDETDKQDYFDFDNVEGIDLDNENDRLQRVLRFTDCNNFTVPINSNHMDDFLYLSQNGNLVDNIFTTLNKSASDAYEQSGSGIAFEGFQLSLLNSLILQVPKAVVSTVFSPKMMFPIAVTYQALKNTNISIKDLMKEMFNLFFDIIKALFWNFIKEFWKYVKKDLLNFLKEIAQKIILNNLKKFKTIIATLISILTQILAIGIGSCEDIFNVILNTISLALNKSLKIPIPGLLLVLAESLPGFSSDRAYMNSIERIEAAGVNMGPIYGTENKFPSVVKGIIDGYSEEVDKNSFVKIALKPSIIPSGPGGAVVSPLIEGVGKMF